MPRSRTAPCAEGPAMPRSRTGALRQKGPRAPSRQAQRPARKAPAMPRGRTARCAEGPAILRSKDGALRGRGPAMPLAEGTRPIAGGASYPADETRSLAQTPRVRARVPSGSPAAGAAEGSLSAWHAPRARPTPLSPRSSALPVPAYPRGAPAGVCPTYRAVTLVPARGRPAPRRVRGREARGC